jgi:hypothetical protein
MQPCYWSIKELPGLKEQEQELLKTHGINNTEELLAIAKTPQGKQNLANRLRVNIKYVNKWVALADLARIPSVGCQYCGLLLHASIASVSQLTQTPFPRLHGQILRLYITTMQRKDLCPPLPLVKQWTEEAKAIARLIRN